MGKFLDNRLKFHTASRIGAQTGYSLAQALDPDGHIVRHTGVWAAPDTAFPKNISESTNPKVATTDLVEVFTSTLSKVTYKNGSEWVAVAAGTALTALSGKVLRNSDYPAIELYYQVEMTAVPGSSGLESDGNPQAYHITENGVSTGTRIMDWVAPTAVIKDGSPVAGFSGLPEVYGKFGKDATEADWVALEDIPQWYLTAGTWEFAYISGMLIFDPAQVPGEAPVRFTGFKYIGEYLSDVVEGIEESINGIELEASKVALTGFQAALGTHTEGEGDEAVEKPNESALKLKDTDSVLTAIVAIDKKVDTLNSANVEGAAGLDARITQNANAIATAQSDIATAQSDIEQLDKDVNEKIQLMYQNEEIDTKFEEVNKAFDIVNGEVGSKANSADVYTKAQVYTQAEANAIFLQYEVIDETEVTEPEVAE